MLQLPASSDDLRTNLMAQRLALYEEDLFSIPSRTNLGNEIFSIGSDLSVLSRVSE